MKELLDWIRKYTSCERERERARARARKTERDRARQSERQRDRETERQREINSSVAKVRRAASEKIDGPGKSLRP